MKQVTFNEEQGLFVIPCNDGYSCLGLTVCWDRASKLAHELGECLPEDYRAKKFDGELALYADYERLVERARQKHAATGWRSKSELTPELIGLEGKRVEVVHTWESGERETLRFYVGKSTGFIPCHLFIERRNDDGGCGACLGKIESVRVIGGSR